MAMDGESKKQVKCNLCDMFVKNIKVHLKLNHKGKKPKISGFQHQSSSSLALSKKNALQGQESSDTNYIFRRAEIHNSERMEMEKFREPKPFNKDVADKLTQISDHVYNETKNAMSAIQQVQAAHMPPNPLDLMSEIAEGEAFELKLNMLGLNRMSSILKTNIHKMKVEQCPECKGLFEVKGRLAKREFRDHVGVCGLGYGGLSNGTIGKVHLHTLDIKEEKSEVDEEDYTPDIKKEKPDLDEEDCITDIKKEKLQLEEEDPSNPLATKMWNDVLHADIDKDSIQGRIEKEKVDSTVKFETGEIEIEQCDVEVKVEIKEEPN